jgi:hypothetical protein
VIDLTLAAILALAVVIQIGMATAIVLGLAAFKAGRLFDRLTRELVRLATEGDYVEVAPARSIASAQDAEVCTQPDARSG